MEHNNTHNNNTHNNTHDTHDDTPTQPGLYDASGRIDITARRDAMVKRMRDDKTGLLIWNARNDEDFKA